MNNVNLKIDIFFKKITQHKFFNIVNNISLIFLYLYFLFNHVVAIKNGNISPMAIIIVAMETIVILLLVIRNNPVIRSSSTLAWGVAFCGTFLPLTLIPSGVILSAIVGNVLLITGGLLAITSYLSLNSSFGISPALRKVKTSGLYAVIRHTMYLSYYIIYLGYLNLSFSLYNLSVFIGLIIFITARIYFEEKLLMDNTGYQAYAKEVHYRVLPYIF